MRYFIILFLSICSFASCTVRVNGVKQDDDIDNLVRKEILTKVDTIFKFFQQSKGEKIKEALSNTIQSESSIIDTLIAMKIFDENTRMNVTDEFYIKNGAGSNINTVASELGGYKYSLVFNPISMDTYVFLFTTYSSTSETDLLTAIVFGKEDEEWKIQLINVSPYTYKGKSAPYYSKLAEEQLDYKHIASAYVYTVFSSVLARPVGNNFHYEMEPQMSSVYGTITNEFNKLYPMPMVIDNVKSKPKITSVMPYMSKMGIKPIPTIKYESRILDDVGALKIENDQLHKELLNKMYDLKETSDSIVYDISYIKDDNATTLTIVKAVKE